MRTGGAEGRRRRSLRNSYDPCPTGERRIDLDIVYRTLESGVVARGVQVAQLGEVACKYAAVVAANAALHNEVQDLRGAIRVFARVRPAGTTGDDSPPCTSTIADGEVRPRPSRPQTCTRTCTPTMSRFSRVCMHNECAFDVLIHTSLADAFGFVQNMLVPR